MLCSHGSGDEVIRTPGIKDAEIRAVWASILSPCMNTEEEIHQLVSAVRKAHLNTIIIQVRRSGSVYFNSKLEPRAAAIQNRPEYDPLAILIKEAHDTSGGKVRLDVCAWFNVFPVGRQRELQNAKPAPLTVTHPEWFTRDRNGNVKTSLDPGIPEVHDHIISVIEECLAHYEVDGVNLDFIRYPEEDAGYNPIALKRYNRLTKSTCIPDPDDAAWNEFRRDQITHFVRRCGVSVWRLRPDAVFSIDAVGYGRPPLEEFADSAPYNQVHQNWAEWIKRAYVDVVCRMGYKREYVPVQAQHFRGWADFSKKLQDECPGRLVTIGIGGYFNSTTDTLTQYREAQKRGLGTSIFSYHRPTREASETQKFGAASPFWEILGNEIYTQILPPARPHWKKEYGLFAGFLKDSSGNPVDGGYVQLEGTTYRTKTDGSGFFTFNLLQPRTYSVEADGSRLHGKEIMVKAGSIAFHND